MHRQKRPNHPIKPTLISLRSIRAVFFSSLLDIGARFV